MSSALPPFLFLYIEQASLPGFVEARVQHYENRRREKLAAVRSERLAILNAERGGNHGDVGGMDPIEEARAKAAVMLAAEKKNLKKMQKRLALFFVVINSA
jgi:hypothetical protein